MAYRGVVHWVWWTCVTIKNHIVFHPCGEVKVIVLT